MWITPVKSAPLFLIGRKKALAETIRRGPWEVHASREVYSNEFLRVMEEEVIQPDGKPGIFGLVEFRHPGVGIVPVTEDREVFLVRQFRYANNSYLWEIPGGNSEPGEDVLVAAKRELREETGFLADEWTPLGYTYPQVGIVYSVVHLFLARALREGGADRDGTEEMAVRKLPLREALRQISTGEITDANTIVSLYRVWHYLEELGE